MASQTPKELFDLGVKSNKAKDFIQAKKYFEKACNLNYGGGCGALGDLYDDGKGVEKNLIKAAQFYSKACDLNDKFGCSILGAMQYIGKGVVKNEKQAVEKFEKACKLGKEEACEIFSLEVLCESSDQKACDMSYDKKKALSF
ncbi:sel1 repeat family protein [Helicobacter pylori]|nr:tetratricopeptide repeat protein [Helicobacter pylori]MBH0292293.1 sel1 repeat family protein [Helicobacter pylori]NHA84949.1 sel1 repeat family protein [Helicobacter pylori]